MSTPVSFFTTYAPTAKKVQAATGLFASVALAQWANETRYGESLNWPGYEWNFAGIAIYGPGSTNGFPSRTAGIQAYIENIKATTYASVLAAKTWDGQAKALGASPWATGHYESTQTGGYPGSELVAIIQQNNLAQYDSGVGGASRATTVAPLTGKVTDLQTTQAAFFKAYGTVAPPPTGFGSTASTGDIVINGSTVSEIMGDAVITVQVTLSITKASTITLTVHDPTRRIVNNPIFTEQATLTLGTTTWVLFGIEKEGSVLTATFIPWVVYALQNATGAFTIPPGQMTRTQFAQMLVSQIEGSTFWFATDSYLASLKPAGYAHTTKEQLSRGTIDSPLEPSWTCLQRLASEIQWVCFESFGSVYFGPYSYLASQLPSFAPEEFKNGVTTITGTYTTGQPTGEITISCVAGSWTPTPGECVLIANLGAFNGNWIVSELTREDIEEPTITVTCMQPLPGLPEPSSGGTNPAVGYGAGNVQSTGGKTAAAQAVKFALEQVGKAYSETPGRRLGPGAYDCSGLVYEAYINAGVHIGGPNHTTFTMWPNGAGTHVPAGAANLLAGDLLFFTTPPYASNKPAQHVAMVVSVTKKRGTVKVVEAADPTQGVITTSNVNPTVGAAYGPTLVYLGATRPAP